MNDEHIEQKAREYANEGSYKEWLKLKTVETAFEKTIRNFKAGYNQSVADFAQPAATPSPDQHPHTEALREAAKTVIDSMCWLYTSGNGRKMSIQDTTGEKCWIVPDESIDRLKAVLNATPAQPAQLEIIQGLTGEPETYPQTITTVEGQPELRRGEQSGENVWMEPVGRKYSETQLRIAMLEIFSFAGLPSERGQRMDEIISELNKKQR